MLVQTDDNYTLNSVARVYAQMVSAWRIASDAPVEDVLTIARVTEEYA